MLDHREPAAAQDLRALRAAYRARGRPGRGKRIAGRDSSVLLLNLTDGQWVARCSANLWWASNRSYRCHSPIVRIAVALI